MGAIRIFEESYLNPKQSHETAVDVSDEAMNKWFELLAMGYQLESKIDPEDGERFNIFVYNPKTKTTLDYLNVGFHAKDKSKHISWFLEELEVGPVEV